MKLLILFLLCAAFSSGYATNYYFSHTQGDDSRTSEQARSSSGPWKTIQKLNSILSTLQPGDSILFKSGDTFFGVINLSKSGLPGKSIVFSSYGTGAKPIITGLKTQAGLTNSGGNIWQSTLQQQTEPNMVLFDGVPVARGRFPNINASNGGYLSIDNFTGNTSIQDNDLIASTNYTGGSVVIRKNRWVLDRNVISNHSGNTINYKSETNSPASKNYGYFIQNHPQTLNQAGEWFFNVTTKRFGIHMGSSNPSAKRVDLSSLDVIFKAQGQSHITVNNIRITGANASAFDLTNSNNFLISNCEVLYSGTNALSLKGVKGLVLKNSVIDFSNNVAIYATGSSDLTISNNKISNTGIFPGMGKGGSGSYEAILVDGNNMTIESNTIQNTGYIPITFRGDNITVSRNFINEYGYVKDDGGGIYTWNNIANVRDHVNQKIISNIILNGRGAGHGTDNPSHLQIHGIYMDDNAANVEISHNTVAHVAQHGIFIHNAHALTITANTIFDNRHQVVVAHDNIAAHRLVRDISLQKNIFFAATPGQVIAEFKTIKDDLRSFGNFDQNSYSHANSDEPAIKYSYRSNNTGQNHVSDLDGWRHAFAKDINSTSSPFSNPLYAIVELKGKNKFSNGNFDINISGASSYSPMNNMVTSWVSNSGLTGGSMSIAFNKLTGSSRRGSVILRIGEVAKNKNYVLRFSVLGTKEQRTIEAFVRKSLAPYNDLSIRTLRKITDKRTDYELMISPLISEPDASIVFDIAEQSGRLLIDNLEFYEATIKNVVPDQNIRFEYNATSTSRTISLSESYGDVWGKLYSGRVVLQPYSSVILIRNTNKPDEEEEKDPPVTAPEEEEDEKDPPVTAPEEEDDKDPEPPTPVEPKPPVPVDPRPIPNEFNFTGIKKGSLIELQWQKSAAANISFFEVEKSGNGTSFKKIGKVSLNAPATYIFQDIRPLTGKNYFRVKVRTNNAQDFYSRIITIDHSSLAALSTGSTVLMKREDMSLLKVSITPNPTQSFVRLSFNQSVAETVSSISVQSANGSGVSNIPVQKGSAVYNINVHNFSAGIYYFKVVAGKEIITRQIVKL